jgi:anti-sigma factor RsiW
LLRAAALLALGVLAGGLGVTAWRGSGESAGDRLARDLLASHLRALAAASPVDVVSSDRHTVKPWFAGKVAVAPPVVDLADQGFPLAGARIDYVGDARVAVLVYRHGQHLIDVYLVDAPGTTRNDRGYHLEPLRLGGQPAVAVTDLDEQELARFVQALP